MNPLELFSDELENLVERAAPSVVALEHRRGHGTGLALSADGFVLTNAHVVQASSRPLVRFHDGAGFEGKWLAAMRSPISPWFVPAAARRRCCRSLLRLR